MSTRSKKQDFEHINRFIQLQNKIAKFGFRVGFVLHFDTFFKELMLNELILKDSRQKILY